MPYIVLIGGGTSSGKTTIAEKIKEKLSHLEPLILSQDDYYRNNESSGSDKAEKYNFDSHEAIDEKLLSEDIKILLSGGKIRKKEYDFALHHRRETENWICSSELIIIEGLFTIFFDRVRKLSNLSVYIDVDADLRLIRRIRRDIAQRGRTLEQVLKQYEREVKPMHEFYEPKIMQNADIILENPCEKDLKDLSVMICENQKNF